MVDTEEDRQQPVRALALAGLAATWVALTIGYWLPALGLPRIDVALWNGNLLVPDSSSAAMAWVAGLLQALGLGTLVGIFYGRWLRPRLPGTAALRGAILGAVMAVLTGMTMMPLLYGAGPFGLRWNPLMPIALVVIHLAYGVALGVAERL